MVDKKLIHYIKKTKKQGFSQDEIITSLKDAGWNDQQIQEAFHDAASTKSIFEKLKIYKRTILLAAVIIILIPFLVYGGMQIAEQFSNEEAPAANENENMATPEPRKEEVEEKTQMREEDLVRMRDFELLETISIVENALGEYFEILGEYPATLQDLITENILSELPQDTESASSYTYTPLGTPAAYYTLSFILETKIGHLDNGLNTVTSEDPLPYEELVTDDAFVQGASIHASSPLLRITDLLTQPVTRGDEVFVEVEYTGEQQLSRIQLETEWLTLTRKGEPFVFQFTAPDEPGVYTVYVFAFDEQGAQHFRETRLVVKP